MRTYCPWCMSPTDYLDQVTTRCPECAPVKAEALKLVSVQSAEGVITYRRGREAKTAAYAKGEQG